MGEEIDRAMQHAPQPGRQGKGAGEQGGGGAGEITSRWAGLLPCTPSPLLSCSLALFIRPIILHYEAGVRYDHVVTHANLPTPADVERIAALTDPVARNRLITQCYHELAVGLAGRLPGAANWCAVATWASRQAGVSIRQEDLRRALERLLRESREARQALETMAAEGAIVREEATESLAGAAEALRDALSPAAAFERTAGAVARGNRKVFAEIGLEFARFLALFEDGPPHDVAFGAFLDSLRPGDPPDGQRLLRAAFTHYRAALGEPDDKRRAELMLLANLEIGFHEQTRLQPEIREAMDAPVYEPSALRRRLLDELFPDPAAQLRLAAARLAGWADPLLSARDRLADEMQRLGRLLITDALMTLELPGGRVLRLGQALPGEIPAPLRRPANAELRALLRPLASAAAPVNDWSELPSRMRFIAGLFRAYHTDVTIFDPPFTATQET